MHMEKTVPTIEHPEGGKSGTSKKAKKDKKTSGQKRAKKGNTKSRSPVASKKPDAVEKPLEGVVEAGETIAQQVNKLHSAARTSCINAVEMAIECGKILIEQKASLPHGKFQQWVEKNCEFGYRAASNYMRATKAAKDGLPFTSLVQLYGSAGDGAEEKEAKDKKRDTMEAPTQLQADVDALIRNLEDIHLPAMSADAFIGEVGADFMSDKAARKLQWIVEMFDAVTSAVTAPGAA